MGKCIGSTNIWIRLKHLSRKERAKDDLCYHMCPIKLFTIQVVVAITPGPSYTRPILYSVSEYKLRQRCQYKLVQETRTNVDLVLL